MTIASRLRNCLVLVVYGAATPLVAVAEDSSPGQRPLAELIDEQIAAGWSQCGVQPAAGCTDAEFLRRVTLDLTGTIPTAARVRVFLAEPAADKRTTLVDDLLASPEHARHMQHTFDVFLLERQHANYVTDKEWREYLRTSFLANKPWDQLVREMLSVDGLDPAIRPALRFALVRTQDSNRTMNHPALTRDIGRLLLGVNLQCAQCHNHPSITDYKQADYYGLMAFVNRSYVGSVKQGDKQLFVLAEKADGDVKFSSVFDEKKEVFATTPHLPGESQLVEPEIVKGQEYAVPPADGVLAVPAYSRREQLARLLPSADNRAFARNMANRLWAMMLGRGLVHPLEVHHSENPPSHPQLLELLTDRFIDEGFDMRAMLREIALSRTYQLSSAIAPDAARSKPEVFALRDPRGLPPESLALAVMQATGYVDSVRLGLGANTTEAVLYEKLSSTLAAFAKTFAGPAGQPETEFQASLDQALFIEHGGQIQSLLAKQPGHVLDRCEKLENPAEELYLSVLSRLPTVEEASEVAKLCENKVERPAALQDLLWAFLASAEFRFNH